VVTNLTVTDPTADAFVTVWLAGSPMPLASVQNTTPGMTRANQVTVRTGPGGIGLFNSTGTVHAIVDVTGYYR
jgi:hypothetical protein